MLFLFTVHDFPRLLNKHKNEARMKNTDQREKNMKDSTKTLVIMLFILQWN